MISMSESEKDLPKQEVVSLLQSRKSVVDLVYEVIKDAILCGKYPMGMVLNQVSLARELQVSRAPVREALRRLQAENLVAITPNQQALVTSISLDLFRDIMEVREVLECHVLRLAIEPHWGKIDFDNLMNLETKLMNERQSVQWLKIDREWHAVFIHAAGNKYIAQLIDDIRQNIERMFQAYGQTYPRGNLAVQEHEAIRDAVMAKNFELAEGRMRAHIRSTYQHLASWLAERGTEPEP